MAYDRLTHLYGIRLPPYPGELPTWLIILLNANSRPHRDDGKLCVFEVFYKRVTGIPRQKEIPRQKNKANQYLRSS